MNTRRKHPRETVEECEKIMDGIQVQLVPGPLSTPCHQPVGGRHLSATKTGYLMGEVSRRATRNYPRHRKTIYIHRAAWMAHNHRRIPSNREIHHVCENKWCANPDHLQVVTHRQNLLASDTVIRRNVERKCCSNCGGRYRRYGNKRACPRCHRIWSARRMVRDGIFCNYAIRWSGHFSMTPRLEEELSMPGNASLLVAQVREIRRRHAEGELAKDLAREFGVAKCTMSAALNGKGTYAGIT